MSNIDRFQWRSQYAFPGRPAIHPEDQIEEENEENLRKNETNYGKMKKDWYWVIDQNDILHVLIKNRLA